MSAEAFCDACNGQGDVVVGPKQYKTCDVCRGTRKVLVPTVPDYRALLIKYMARVIDIEGVSYIETWQSCTDIEFEGAERSLMRDLEAQARKEYNL